MADDRITLKIPGRKIENPSLPRILQASTRGISRQLDEQFLPPGLVQVVDAYDLSALARSADGGEKNVATHREEIIALELADGVTIFTSPDNLRKTLAQVSPDAVGDDGSIRIDGLRERGVATRGIIGDVVSNVVSRVFTLKVGEDVITEAARRKALEWLGETAEDKFKEYAEIGVTWLGTKALMWSIESQLSGAPGLYRWSETQGEPTDFFPAGDPRLPGEANQGPILVFIHGTGSSTAGSFSDLKGVSKEYWRTFQHQFGERIYAFEHRTLSESPIDNALHLARILPAGAQLNLVTHSRGGLIGDLLCLDNLKGGDRDLIQGYALDNLALGDLEPAEAERLTKELQHLYDDQRNRLQELAEELAAKKFRLQRYVRVACPARGTRLASGNFDVFLSSLLTLIGMVPALAGSPLYWAFKRVVLEIAKNRTKPNLVPGIEAMLPESPIARLLAKATPQSDIDVAIVAGDIEGGGLLKRLGVLFTDFMLFEGVDNDLVVDTDSMYAGVARPGQTWAMFDRGPEISHFRYFTNDHSRGAIRQWLVDANPHAIDLFKPLPAMADPASAEAAHSVRGPRARAAAGPELPVALVLPGIMGSHLWVNRKDRVWFDFDDLLVGGFSKLRWPGQNVEAEQLFLHYYGAFCKHLAATHQVETFPYDWRQPLDKLADRLRDRVKVLLDDTRKPLRPVRIVAHSMGGLLVRGLIHRHKDLWQALMEREGARFIMLGTPNQGSHSIVETLLGKSSTIRMLGRVDLRNNLQSVLDIVGEFRGALQLLPKRGFSDTGHEQKDNYFAREVWSTLRPEMRDFWFGDGIAAVPSEQALTEARWLWDADGLGLPSLPAESKNKVVYVFGSASNTACGIRKEKDRWKLLGTRLGDGSVTWDSGRIGGIGSFYYMPAEHGALADTEDYFPALAELLVRGSTKLLATEAPVTRGVEETEPVAYDAGPPVFPTALDVGGGLLGKRSRVRVRPRPVPTLEVSVKAMNLLFVNKPVLVGHYEQDAISGPEAVLDRELLKNQLTVRHSLGIYAGPIGTATIALLPRNQRDLKLGSYRGAVVAGLSKMDGSLTVSTLTDAVRTAALRYLLHIIDGANTVGRADNDNEIELASLLLGYSSSANLSIADSVTALVRGVAEANRKFAETTRLPLRIARLDVIELYLDTAISATRALANVAGALNQDATLGCQIHAKTELEEREGVRLRLDDARTGAYWSRLMITEAEPHEASMNAVSPGQAPLAKTLKFLYLGPRARAEKITQQRQPGLVEQLVHQQLQIRTYQEDFSRTLFSLLLPQEFKDAARQVDRIVIVLDAYTANLPWELMLADDKPLAVKTAIVRQLESSTFRPGVRQASGRQAFVIGNPSTEGFMEAFPSAKSNPPDLPAAENEANTVVEVLTQMGFDVERSIAEEHALDTINRLYKNPYRILHIAAHGIFEEMHRDGTLRTGVVLADGQLITAAEIDSMEIVPDLVFLNCCHLGKIVVADNKLAASVARELIKIGVRAVVVAGWAVDDEPASFFANRFYTHLLQEKASFGESVFRSRQETWEGFPASITWGAYQAYGDPGWIYEPQVADGVIQDTDSTSESSQDIIDRLDQSTGGSAGRSGWKPVAPQELLARLDEIRMSIGRIDTELSKSERKDIERLVHNTLKVAPDSWSGRADVNELLGQLYGELGPEYFSEARSHYEKSIQNRTSKLVSIRAIEELANLEARQGESTNSIAFIQSALRRLEGLATLTQSSNGKARIDLAQLTPERASLFGSAYKRKAAVHARLNEPAALKDAIREAEKFYRSAAGDLDHGRVDPYPALNWLFFLALTGNAKEMARGVELARQCASVAEGSFRQTADFWDAVMLSEAALVECLLDRTFGNPNTKALNEIEKQYRTAFQGVVVRPKEFDSVVQQICLSSDIYVAWAQSTPGAESKVVEKIGERLGELAERLKPGVCDRTADIPPELSTSSVVLKKQKTTRSRSPKRKGGK